MAQLRLRQALPSLIALRRSLSPSPLLKPSISSSFSLSSRQQRDTCSLLTSLVQLRACTSYTTVSENNSCTSHPKVSENNSCTYYQTVSESNSCTFYPTVSENKISHSEWFRQGVNHWHIVMNFGDLQPTREAMIRTYMETFAKVLNISLEEAKQRIYAAYTANIPGFGAKMSTEESKKFKGVSRVVIVFPDPGVEQNYQKYRGDDDMTFPPRTDEDWLKLSGKHKSPYVERRWERLQNEIREKIQDDVYKSSLGNYRKGVHGIIADLMDLWLEEETAKDLWPENETDDVNDLWPENETDNLNDLCLGNETDYIKDLWARTKSEFLAQGAADNTPPADEVCYGQGPN